MPLSYLRTQHTKNGLNEDAVIYDVAGGYLGKEKTADDRRHVWLLVTSSVTSRRILGCILLYFSQKEESPGNVHFQGILAEKPGFEPGLPFLTLLP